MLIRRSCGAALLALALAALSVPGAAVAQAEGECAADPAGDVVSGETGAALEEPRGDLTEACWEYDGATLTVSFTVAEATDPLATAEWDDFGSVLIADLDNGYSVQLGKISQNETFESAAFAGDDSPSCVGEATFDAEAGTYGAAVESACIGSPDAVAVAFTMVFGGDFALQQTSGAVDEIGSIGGPGGPNVTRLQGPERIATAVAISQSQWETADNVVMARADVFADALAGAQLAAALQGPLLLTNSQAVPDNVLGELERLLGGLGGVHLLGGEAAIAPDVEDQLIAAGYVVTRHAGATRYATSVMIAEAANTSPEAIFVATGNDFPEALAAGATAPSGGATMVLSDGANLPAEVAEYLATHADIPVFAVGPDAAAAVPEGQPIVGNDFYETSALLATGFTDPQAFAVASGERFPDGLAGGAYAATRGIPLLLSPAAALPETVEVYLSSEAPFGEAVLFGGEAALSQAVEAAAASYVEGSSLPVTGGAE